MFCHLSSAVEVGLAADKTACAPLLCCYTVAATSVVAGTLVEYKVAVEVVLSVQRRCRGCGRDVLLMLLWSEDAGDVARWIVVVIRHSSVVCPLVCWSRSVTAS